MNLTNLTDLGLDVNQITDVTALANLTNLRMLWLSYNQITLDQRRALYLAMGPQFGTSFGVFRSSHPRWKERIQRLVPQLVCTSDEYDEWMRKRRAKRWMRERRETGQDRNT